MTHVASVAESSGRRLEVVISLLASGGSLVSHLQPRNMSAGRLQRVPSGYSKLMILHSILVLPLFPFRRSVNYRYSDRTQYVRGWQKAVLA